MSRYIVSGRWRQALAAVCVAGAAMPAWAGDYYTTVPFPAGVFIGGTGATPAHVVIGKEYSHNRAVPGADPRIVSFDDHDAFGVPDPLQVVSWDGIPRAGMGGGNSGSNDAFDFGVPGFNYPQGQVDAIANRGDFLFREVIENKASLLFSSTLDTSVVGGVHVWWEDPTGAFGIWADAETLGIAHPPGPGPGVNHHPVFDLDGLEVWGPEPPTHLPGGNVVVEGYIGGLHVADSDRFSLDNDSLSGVSVWAYDIAAKTIAPWVLHADVVAAVEYAFLGAGGAFPREIRDLIDLDALMARDLGQVAAHGLFAPGDEILFSIDPIDAVGIDGGEIIHAYFDAAGGIVGAFLSHGGHLWDTAFDIRGTFGVEFEDIDAIEAVGTLTGDPIDVPDPYIPEPATIWLAGLGLAGIAARRRRRKP
ncbi:MAG: PEP-CTERM sorting domain-containing protein [Pirellulales bacterium]|nr:PEP-CTERM sorting domain-containing protein [Pirellulales bacterium]